jgi:hypothetical protein
MLIVGYCFGIRSERRLCKEVHLNLAYRWTNSSRTRRCSSAASERNGVTVGGTGSTGAAAGSFPRTQLEGLVLELPRLSPPPVFLSVSNPALRVVQAQILDQHDLDQICVGLSGRYLADQRLGVFLARRLSF